MPDTATVNPLSDLPVVERERQDKEQQRQRQKDEETLRAVAKVAAQINRLGGELDAVTQRQRDQEANPELAERARYQHTLWTQRLWLYASLTLAVAADMTLLLANPASSATKNVFGENAFVPFYYLVLAVLGTITAWVLLQIKRLSDTTSLRIRRNTTCDLAIKKEAEAGLRKARFFCILGIVAVTSGVFINITLEHNKLAQTIFAQRVQAQEVADEQSSRARLSEIARGVERDHSGRREVKPVGLLESLPGNTWAYLVTLLLHLVIFGMPAGGSEIALDSAKETPLQLERRVTQLEAQIDRKLQKFAKLRNAFSDTTEMQSKLRAIVPARVWALESALIEQSNVTTESAGRPADTETTTVPGAETAEPRDPNEGHV